jgi:ACT domain-containing protein
MKLEHLNNIVNYEQFLRKKQQLKLGSISFELKTINISGISVYEYLEMKYTRQDMTNEKESSLEFRLNKLA